MRRLVLVLSYVLIAGTVLAAQPRYRNILLRDFRTVLNGEVVTFNIGTAAHCPATIAALRKELPDDVSITVWADTTLCPELQQMMTMRFPDVAIVYGSLDHPSVELMAAVNASDLLLVSSGAGIHPSVAKSLVQYKRLTGKSTAAYAVGWGKSMARYTEKMDFCWIRDKKACAKANMQGGLPEISGFAPDAVFDFDVYDVKGADKFLKQNILRPGEFLCCIPGYRHTPSWEFFGTPVSEKNDMHNKQMQGQDNEILRKAICNIVRKHRKKVLICAENVPELKLCKLEVYDKLPDDVKRSCVLLENLWSPQLALGVYRKSLCVFGIEMHSQVMAVGNGIPACVFHHSGFGSKAYMFDDIGLGKWRLDIDSEDASVKAIGMIEDILLDQNSAKALLKLARKNIDNARRQAVSSSFVISASRTMNADERCLPY